MLAAANGSECEDVGKNTHTFIAAQLLIMVMLVLLYWADGIYHTAMREREGGGILQGRESY